MDIIPQPTTRDEGENATITMSNAPSDSADGHERKALLACDRCKKRKIKCDRTRPICHPCLKTSKSCEYPTSSQKPGPKPGAPQRRKVRRINGVESIPYPYPSPTSGRDSRPVSKTISDESRGASSSTSIPFGSTFGPSDAVGGQYSNAQPRFNNSFIQPQTQQSPRVSISSPATEKSTSRGSALSQILHLSHDPVPNDEPQTADSAQIVGQWRGIEAVCADLEISPDIYPCLLSAYFENITAFSLFHRPTFDTKISSISSPVQQRALLASMFALSARFTGINQSHAVVRSNIPTPEHFRKIAEESVDQALRDCLDESPPLCLLQALILTTFQQLTNGVRGRSWRALHTCVSIAYDLHLHLVDKSIGKKTKNDTECHLLEEKRRAWWTIWEFDVFASTIRKLPTAIDWTNNETWLPVDDDRWFNNTVAKSCILNPDPAVAWKELEKSGNQSVRAWFIVINALMRCAHIVAFPHVYTNKDSPSSEFSSGIEDMQAAQTTLDVLANSLYCMSAALPENLLYNGEFLNFSNGNSLQNDAAKHSIHIMTQLSRFMLNHLRVFNSTYRQLGIADTSSSDNPEEVTPENTVDSVDKPAWNVYLAAASEIVTIVRNSSPKHVRYVNPFLSSTIWLAAAAQIISRKIGPHLVNRRVAESNFDLLQMNLDAYVSFWGVSSFLQQKLKVLEARLEIVGALGAGSEAPKGHQATNSGAAQVQPQANPNGTLPYDPTNAIHYLSPNQHTSISPMDGTQVPNLEMWSGQQLSNFGDGMALDLTPNNSWGYGLDELLMYGGFE